MAKSLTIKHKNKHANEFATKVTEGKNQFDFEWNSRSFRLHCEKVLRFLKYQKIQTVSIVCKKSAQTRRTSFETIHQ